MTSKPIEAGDRSIPTRGFQVDEACPDGRPLRQAGSAIFEPGHREYQIAIDNGDRMMADGHALTAELAIRKDGGFFVVDHMPTGHRVCEAPNRDAAERAVIELDKAADWQFTNKKDRPEANVRVYARHIDNCGAENLKPMSWAEWALK